MKNNRNPKIVYIILIIILFLTGILSLLLGSEKINIIEGFCDILNNKQSSNGRILRYVRFPRTVGGILGGFALGLSGAIIQSVLSNSLGSPSTIGVNSGAGFFVAIFAALFPDYVMLYPVASLVGGFLGALIVIGIGEKAGASKISLVLAGVAVSAVFNAGIDTVLTFVPDALNGYSDFRIGGLNNISLKDLFPGALFIFMAFGIGIMLHNELDILMLGIEESQTLGLPGKAIRLIFLALAAILAGSAISFTGLIGFVGLIVPHVMREFVGEESKPLMVTSALGGAVLLLASDMLSRIIFAPYELPVGIVMAFIGGPFFIYLLKKRGKSHD